MREQALPIKMLVVDDSADVGELVRATFWDKRWLVLSASDGVIGLEMAQREKPAVVLLDIVLPRLQGWHVCETLKGSRETDRTKIIMISALIQGSIKKKAMQSGADAYIEKPFSPRHLVETVEKVLPVDVRARLLNSGPLQR